MKLDIQAVAMTAAFFMEGLRDSGKYADILEAYGDGATNLVGDLVSHAEFCESLWLKGEAKYRDAPGVWMYEVASEFGCWYGTLVLANGYPPIEKECRAELTSLSNAFWRQCHRVVIWNGEGE